MKTCTKCKIEKDEAEFSKKTRSNDGLDYRCKSCFREYQRTDAIKAYHEAYRQSDVQKAYRKAYQQSDAQKEYQKAYRLRKKAAASSGTTGQSTGN